MTYTKSSFPVRKRLLTLVVSFGMAVFSACSEDSSTVVTQSGLEVFSSADDLPSCTKDNEGDQAFIKGETSARICVDGKWFATLDTAGNDFHCSTVKLADGTGLKIMCNGDSVGVVLNGAKGETGAQGQPGTKGEPGTPADTSASCSMEEQAGKLAIQCGDKSARFNIAEDGTITVDTTILDSEKVASSLSGVYGFVQKGPFLRGTSVSVTELESGRSLEQTGTPLDVQVLSDDGEFFLSAHTTVSQYIELVGTGVYRNEVTGGLSNATIALRAITDLRARAGGEVNINLLTHLEYSRVKYLVLTEKMKFAAAKRQAEQEILDLFHIDSEHFFYSEELNIIGTSDGDAALLAVSVMLLGDRNVSQLSGLLGDIASDMEKDGTWDNSAEKIAIADWAADADSAGKLAIIRSNIESWNLSQMVPKFEPYVRQFWYAEYGLGDCTADSVDMVKAATAGKRKGSNTRYLCKETDAVAGEYRWVVASGFEKDTYGWADSTDGALKVGSLTGTKYVFDSTGSINGTKGWRLAENVEKTYGGCTKDLYDSIRTYRGTNEAGYYQCQENVHKWVKTSNNLLIDTQGWTESSDGFSQWGDSIGVVSGGNRICYVYDTSATYNGWRVGHDNDCTLGLYGCTAGRAGKMLLANNAQYYNCANNTWTVVKDRILANTNGWDCKDSNDGEMKLGLSDNSVYFICDNHSWREASTDEEIDCRANGKCIACTQIKQGAFETMNGVEYVCDSKEWRTPNCAEAKVRSLCTANDSAVVWGCELVEKSYWGSNREFYIDYVCSDNKWHAVKSPFEYTLESWLEKKGNYFTSENLPNAVFGDNLVDQRDNHVYRTVVVAGMTWMAENLNFVDTVGYATLRGQTGCYNNEEKNCSIGGRIYTWSATMNLDAKWNNADASTTIDAPYHQGICPNGWHVPNKSEWEILTGNDQGVVGSVAAKDAMAKGYSDWSDAVDRTGLALLPTGTWMTGRPIFSVADGSSDRSVVGVSEFMRWGYEHYWYHEYENHVGEGLNVFLRCVKSP